MTAKKLLVVSDIHGAMAGAELVLDALRTHNPSSLTVKEKMKCQKGR